MKDAIRTPLGFLPISHIMPLIELIIKVKEDK
jgi:hypothetical protein